MKRFEYEIEEVKTRSRFHGKYPPLKSKKRKVILNCLILLFGIPSITLMFCGYNGLGVALLYGAIITWIGYLQIVNFRINRHLSE